MNDHFPPTTVHTQILGTDARGLPYRNTVHMAVIQDPDPDPDGPSIIWELGNISGLSTAARKAFGPEMAFATLREELTAKGITDIHFKN